MKNSPDSKKPYQILMTETSMPGKINGGLLFNSVQAVGPISLSV
jgi:hypothetical protein